MDGTSKALVAFIVILLIGWGIFEVLTARRGGKK